ncbi:MAG: ferritin-like domain-containing protein [Gemmatimonadaceae bacterium]
MSDRKTFVVEHPAQLWRTETRREFLRLLGVGGSIVMLPAVLASCGDDDDDGMRPPPNTGVTLNLSTETGILNYAYALEQLEAAFYTQVVASSVFGTLTAELQEVFTDLRNHEVAHREFLKAALTPANAIASLSVNQSTFTTALANRDSILKTSEQFEDLGVAAYNGAGKYLTGTNLMLAGKIVSVEARHAAAIRDIRDALGITGGAGVNTRFAGDDVVDSNGRDVVLEPANVRGRVASANVLSTTLTIGTNPPTRAGSGAEFGPPNPTP